MGNKQSRPADFSDLATGTPHGFVCGARAVLHSDFNHTGTVDHSDAERRERHRRTGSILLPLLAGSESVAAQYLTAVDVCPAGEGDLRADDLLLQFVNRSDRERVVGYREIPARPGNFDPVLGDAMVGAEVPMPLGENGTRFWLCAATLAGDPRAAGPGGRPAPPEPQTERGHDRIAPGEVWVRLRHRQGGADQPEKDDHALFQIAPLVLQSNLEPARRLYVVSTIENQNFVYDVMEACWDAFGANGPFEREPSSRFSASTPRERRNHADRVAIRDQSTREPLLSPAKMYLINGNRYKNARSTVDDPDVWVQDQMTTGYCSAPGGRAFHVVMNCKRAGALHAFVEGEIPEMGNDALVFNGLSTRTSTPHDLTDYGGNITVSPPVKTNTKAADAGPAGPRVPRHPPAPHGKILLGDHHNPHRALDLGGQRKRTGIVHEHTRNFLQAQQVQPIVPINTSWLDAGHVDEIMAFVPGTGGPQLAMARPDVMIKLLDKTKKVPFAQGRTHFHRGRYGEHFPQIGSLIKGLADNNNNFARSYDETSVEHFHREYGRLNRQICNRFLKPIQHRLRRCTGLARRHILPLPVYFCHANPQTRDAPWGRALAEARTPNLVNMQVLKTGPEETHLLVPRPCGPRLPPDKARKVVRAVLNASGQKKADVHLPQDRKHNQPGFPFWAWPNLKARTLALFFTREKPGPQGSPVPVTEADRNQLIDVIKREQDFNTLPPNLQQAVQHTEDTILNANDRPLLDNGEFPNWNRLFIPEDTVDVIEAYTQSVLARIGCTVHFVDAWFYHSGCGGVHCATNVLHEVPPPQKAQWWTAYPDLAAADTTYDPGSTTP